jgi:nitrous oxide reductase
MHARFIGGLTMRKEQEDSRLIDRRRLLKGAGLAIGAAGAGSAVVADEAAAAVDESKPRRAGYRETELVKTYYKLARF